MPRTIDPAAARQRVIRLQGELLAAWAGHGLGDRDHRERLFAAELLPLLEEGNDLLTDNLLGRTEVQSTWGQRARSNAKADLTGSVARLRMRLQRYLLAPTNLSAAEKSALNALVNDCAAFLSRFGIATDAQAQAATGADAPASG